MKNQRSGGGPSWLLPALLAVVAYVAATVLWLQVDTPEEPKPATRTLSASAETAPAETAPAAPRSVTAAQPAKALDEAGPPRGVVIDSLGIEAPVVPIATDGTSLDPPDDPQVLGWWSGGAQTGAEQGTALVTGHTVNAGGGAMDDLELVRVGAEIRVTTAQGTIRYRAESVQVLDKDTLARQAQQLFSQEVAGRLVLVTCEDWDGHGYRSNVVVTAVPA